MAKYQEVPIENIVINEVKIREPKTDTAEFAGLKRSIAVVGIQQPVYLVPLKNKETGKLVPNMYNLWDGLQRLTCAKEHGFKTVPAFIRTESFTEADEFCIQMMLNRNRVTSNPKEEMQHIKNFMFRNDGYTREKVAEIFFMTVQELGKRLNYEKLSPEGLELLASGKIKASAGYFLSTIPIEYQHKIQIGDEVKNPTKLAMSMEVSEFIASVSGWNKALKKARQEGSTKIESVIIPMPLKKPRLIEIWGEAQDAIETSVDISTDDYKVAQGHLEMIERVLQVDAASLKKKKEDRDADKEENSLKRAKKRKEDADKQYEIAMKKASESQSDSEVLAESIK